MLSASILLLAREPKSSISPFLHGHFIEHLGELVTPGLWVGPDSPVPNQRGLRSGVVEALRELAPTVLRWPGGCFADAYNWRDGVGPREMRPTRVTSRWGADEIETNGLGTHEFMDLCREIGAEPWLAANVGSGTPREMAHWVEYCNFPGGTTISDARQKRRQQTVRREVLGHRQRELGLRRQVFGERLRRAVSPLREQFPTLSKSGTALDRLRPRRQQQRRSR